MVNFEGCLLLVYTMFIDNGGLGLKPGKLPLVFHEYWHIFLTDWKNIPFSRVTSTAINWPKIASFQPSVHQKIFSLNQHFEHFVEYLIGFSGILHRTLSKYITLILVNPAVRISDSETSLVKLGTSQNFSVWHKSHLTPTPSYYKWPVVSAPLGQFIFLAHLWLCTLGSYAWSLLSRSLHLFFTVTSFASTWISLINTSSSMLSSTPAAPSTNSA